MAICLEAHDPGFIYLVVCRAMVLCLEAHDPVFICLVVCRAMALCLEAHDPRIKSKEAPSDVILAFVCIL